MVVANDVRGDAGAANRTGSVQLPGDGARSRQVTVALVSDPGAATELATELAERLPGALTRLVSADVEWRAWARCEPLATGQQQHLAEIAQSFEPTERARDLTVLVTDLPRREATDPITVETDRARRVAVLSLPALGVFGVRRRAEQAVAAAAAGFARAETTTDRQHAGDARLRARLRLLAGMVRANRPWRLFAGLSKALAGVFGTAALVMLNSVGWQLGDTLGAGRLVLLAALSVTALTTWLIVSHELWERPDTEQGKRLARLYNATTAITLGLGVLALYAGLFAVLTAVSAVVFDASVLQSTLRHAPTWVDRLGIVWFATSAAMVGGALGSGLEDDSVVRQAAYGERQRQRAAQDADQRR